MSLAPDLDFDHYRFDNGLTVIGERNPNAQTVAAGYFVNTGARDESGEVAGVSHFLEHMMFKGTPRRSGDDINREFDELGARYNAYTSEERTVYYGAVLPERAPRLLDLLTDMMRPSLRDEDFEVEKKVILEEIAMYEDRPNFRVFEQANRRFFNGHPLGNSVLGTSGTIGALTRDQMHAYFEERYAPDNLVFALAGNYRWDDVLELLGQATAAWQPRGSVRRYPPFQPEHGRESLSDEGLNRIHLAAYAPGVSAQDDRRYAASVLATCLGDSTGSRLYWALVDRGLADSAVLWHDGNDGIGSFQGYLSTAPERADEVERLFRDTLLEAQGEGITAQEWQRAQRKLATGLTLRGETPFGRLMSLGGAYLYTGRYQSVQDVASAILTARLEQGAALLAERPFDRLYLYALVPGA